MAEEENEKIGAMKDELQRFVDTQELRSAKALEDIYSISEEQFRGNLITLDYVPPEDEGSIIDMSMRKTADVLAKTLEKIAKIDIDEELKDVIPLSTHEDPMEQFGFEDFPRESKPFKGEELIRQKQRASMFIAQRASIFPPALGDTGMRTSISEVQRKMRRMTEFDKPSTSPAEPSLQTLDTRIDSENLGMQSMILNIPPTTPLSSLQIAGIVNILQETLDRLSIVRHMIPANIDDRWDSNTVKTIDEKYSVPDEPRVIFREEMGLPPLTLNVAEKMQRDRTYVYNVLRRTVNQLENSGRFDPLESEVDNIAKFQEAERNLEAECQIWMSQVKQLRDLIKADKANNKRKKERILDLVQQTNTQVDDTIFLNGSKLGYAERWEDARLEQQKIKFALKEQELSDDFNECLKQQNADEIVSGEVCTYLEANIKDLEDEVMAWTSRYNDEIEQKQSEIDELKEAIEVQKMELQKMYELRDQRQTFIDKCYAEEEEILREAEYWRVVHTAATMIQSLWRGYSVRHELGQFRNLRAKLKARKRRAARGRKKKEARGRKKQKNQ